MATFFVCCLLLATPVETREALGCTTDDAQVTTTSVSMLQRSVGVVQDVGLANKKSNLQIEHGLPPLHEDRISKAAEVLGAMRTALFDVEQNSDLVHESMLQTKNPQHRVTPHDDGRVKLAVMGALHTSGLQQRLPARPVAVTVGIAVGGALLFLFLIYIAMAYITKKPPQRQSMRAQDANRPDVPIRDLPIRSCC